MSLHLITGYAGQEHITAADHASFNISMFGAGEYVLDKGNKFKAEIISNNLIRILDGDMMIQGRHVRLAENTYEEVMIENGTQGMKRNDLIVARYSKDATTGIEKCEFVVLKGEANASAAVDPTYTTGDITENGNDLVTEFPLYRVSLNGLSIESVTKLFKVCETVQSVKDDVVRTIGYTMSKNYLPNTGTTLTNENVTHTHNDDGSVTSVGTCNNGETIYSKYTICKNLTLKKGKKLILSGCPSGGSATTYKLDITGANGKPVYIDYGEGCEINLEEDTTFNEVRIIVYGGTTINATFYPMISEESGEYEPYVPSVKSLVCDVEKIDVSKNLSIAANTATLIHTYKAVKRCKISMSVFVCGENAAICPAFISVYLGDRVVSYNRLASANGHAMTIPVNMILEAGETIATYTQFFHAGKNTVIITGYAQNLE